RAGPYVEHALADRLAGRYSSFAQQVPGFAAVVEATLKGEHVEAAFLMEELDQPGSRMEGGAVAVRLFAELDNASIADALADGLEVSKILISRVDRTQGRQVLFQPGDARFD